MFWRVIQAFGASSGLSVGAGAISDMYRLEERGQAMGIFFGVRVQRPPSSCAGADLGISGVPLRASARTRGGGSSSALRDLAPHAVGSLRHGSGGVHLGPILVPRDAGPGGRTGEVPRGGGRPGEAVRVAEPRQEPRAAPESEHLDRREWCC